MSEYSYIMIHIRTAQGAEVAEQDIRKAIAAAGYDIENLIVENEEDYNGWADK